MAMAQIGGKPEFLPLIVVTYYLGSAEYYQVLLLPEQTDGKGNLEYGRKTRDWTK